MPQNDMSKIWLSRDFTVYCQPRFGNHIDPLMAHMQCSGIASWARGSQGTTAEGLAAANSASAWETILDGQRLTMGYPNQYHISISINQYTIFMIPKNILFICF